MSDLARKPDDTVLSLKTPLRVSVRLTRAQWERIVQNKHPIMAGKHALVAEALRNPAQVRKSRRDPNVHIYYAPEPGTPYQIAVVVKHLKEEGFVITAYRTDRVKEGDLAWTP